MQTKFPNCETIIASFYNLATDGNYPVTALFLNSCFRMLFIKTQRTTLSLGFFLPKLEDLVENVFIQIVQSYGVLKVHKVKFLILQAKHVHIRSIASIWWEITLGSLSSDVVCSEKKTIFLSQQDKGQRSEHISLQMEAIVFIIFQLFFETRVVLKIKEYHSDHSSTVLAWDIQSCRAFRLIARERKYLRNYKREWHWTSFIMQEY